MQFFDIYIAPFMALSYEFISIIKINPDASQLCK